MAAINLLKKQGADTATLPLDDLLGQYLEVCNRAIEKHQDHFPYSELISLGKKLQGDHVHLAVYDDRTQKVYPLRFRENRLAFHPELSPSPQKAWRVNRSYLEEVVNNPDKYIRHPVLLDLNWLLNRLGI